MGQNARTCTNRRRIKVKNWRKRKDLQLNNDVAFYN